jgi:hypothetical protein
MSDEAESFALELGGRRWDLPHFEFGVLRKLQPKLLRIVSRFAPGGAEAGLQLDEDAIEQMLDIVAHAIAVVDPVVTRDTLDRMRFAIVDLVAAQRVVMKACGMQLRSPAEPEGASDPKA